MITAAPRGDGHAVRIDIRVTPRSSRSGVDGVRAGRLIVRVTAPPVDDAANAATVAVLADYFATPRARLRIVAGATSRNKVIEIAGVMVSDVRTRLGLVEDLPVTAPRAAVGPSGRRQPDSTSTRRRPAKNK